jgi:hypothetical protein
MFAHPTSIRKRIMRARFFLFSIALLVGLTGCAERSQLSAGADTGPNPTLPEPTQTLIPTVKIAPAKGWPARSGHP